MKDSQLTKFVKSLPYFSPVRLRSKRKSLGLTMKQAAILTRVSQHTWKAWENGTNWMPDPTWAYFLIQAKRLKDYKLLQDEIGATENAW